MECRICFEPDRPNTMVIPCRCRGTSAYVHAHCLRTYFSYYPDRICRVCHERMGHPTIDLERNFVCATVLFTWAAVLLALSTVSVGVKLVAYVGLSGLLVFHIQRKQLTYETTFTCLAVSGLLYLADPVFLPQTVFLSVGLLLLLTLCLFVPTETVLLVLVVGLGLVYTLLATFAVALKTDPAFTGLFLLVMVVFWLIFVRPERANEV